MRLALLAGSVLVACSGNDDSDDKNGGPSGSGDRFAEFINTTKDASGDFGCFTPGEDWGATTWLTQTVEPANIGTFPINGHVEDFQEETAVYDANVSLYLADSVQGQPDVTAVSDNNGDIVIDGPSCDPVTYKVTTEGGPIATKTTYKAHSIYPPPTGNAIEDVTFTSVSDVTYQLIPGILGVSVDTDKAIIAGTAFDCSRDPALEPSNDTGKIEGVQVIVYDEDGNIPDTLQVHYFLESFPARDLTATSADGLWVAANVPAGTLRVELWGQIAGTLTLLGATVLESEADSINIANIFTGYGDGVKFPTSCEDAPTGSDTGM